VGTVAKIKQAVKSPDGMMRIVCEGYARAELLALHHFADYYTAQVVCHLPDADNKDLGLREEALLREAKRALSDMKKGKDVSICGFPVRAQVFATKLLPHKIVMKIWCRQQKK